LQGCGPRGSPGIKAKRKEARESHHILLGVLESVREYEGMNPHTPKATPILGRWSPGGLPKFQRAIAGVKPQWIVAFFRSVESS